MRGEKSDYAVSRVAVMDSGNKPANFQITTRGNQIISAALPARRDHIPMTSAEEPASMSTEPREASEQPAKVSKRSVMKWTGERNLLLMNTYMRYMKKEIAHKNIRTEFADAAHVDLETVPSHQTMMNYISQLKKLAISAADLREDIDRYCRTPTEQERYKHLLSAKQKQVREVLNQFGVTHDTELEHDVYKLGNELKLSKSLGNAKKDLDIEKAKYKQKGDELTKKILENRDYARQVREARRKRAASEDDETDEQGEVDDMVHDLESNKRRVAYCESDDPGWASRRSRGEISSSLLSDARLESLRDMCDRTEQAYKSQRQETTKALTQMDNDIGFLMRKSSRMETSMGNVMRDVHDVKRLLMKLVGEDQHEEEDVANDEEAED